MEELLCACTVLIGLGPVLAGAHPLCPGGGSACSVFQNRAPPSASEASATLSGFGLSQHLSFCDIFFFIRVFSVSPLLEFKLLKGYTFVCFNYYVTLTVWKDR